MLNNQINVILLNIFGLFFDYHCIVVVVCRKCVGGGNVKRKQLIDNGWVFNDKQTVCLPHDWSARTAIDRDAPAGNDGGYYPTGVGIYNKVLNLTKDYEGKKLWLYFEGVYQDSEVRVNGKVAGGHPYGYSSFWCDITELVKTGKNDITVKADNSKQKTDLTPFTSKEWKVWKGELLVVVRSGQKSGTISLSASSDGLKSVVTRIKTTK